MTFDPTSVEVTCVTLHKDHCVQVPWEYINVCGYSDQFCKNTTYYVHVDTVINFAKIPHTMCIPRTTYRMSDHIVSFWTQQLATANLAKGQAIAWQIKGLVLALAIAQKRI